MQMLNKWKAIPYDIRFDKRSMNFLSCGGFAWPRLQDPPLGKVVAETLRVFPLSTRELVREDNVEFAAAAAPIKLYIVGSNLLNMGLGQPGHIAEIPAVSPWCNQPSGHSRRQHHCVKEWP